MICVVHSAPEQIYTNSYWTDEEKTKDKLSDDDKETLEDIVKKTTEWIEENGTSGQFLLRCYDLNYSAWCWF